MDGVVENVVIPVVKVDQVGGACHEGYRSCFFRQFENGAADWKIVESKVFDPDAVYKK